MRGRVSTVGVLVLLTACSPGATPAAEFEVADEDVRVLELVEQRRAARETVRLPADTQHVRVRLDCIGEGGDLVVEVGELGTAGVPCGQESSPEGAVGLDVQQPLVEDTDAVVRVTGPNGSVWSAAVDAGPGPLPQGE